MTNKSLLCCAMLLGSVVMYGRESKADICELDVVD